MAWTDIPTSVYAVGKPITSVSYGYLKENIEVHDHTAGRGAQIEQDGLLDYSVGNVLLANSDTEENTASTGYVKIKEVVIIRGGSLRIKFDLKSNLGINTAFARLYVNGSPVGTERSRIATSFQNYSEDIGSLNPQDLVQLYIKVNVGGSHQSIVRNFRLYSDIYHVTTVIS